MRHLDGVKPPVLLKFPDRKWSNNHPAPQQGGSQRQKSAQGGKKAPQVDLQTEREKQQLIIEAAHNISCFVQNLSRELRFSIDNRTDTSGICVWDQNTNQLIRRIPADELIRLSQRLEEDAGETPRGILIDREV